MKKETMTAPRTYSPAIYLAALRHCAGTAAARGAETRRETARNAGTVRMTIAAVLQAASDVTARRAPSPDPETIRETLTPAPALTAPRPRFDIGAAARLASADYSDLLTLDPSARSLPLWYDCLRRAAGEIKDRETLTAPAGFWTLTGDDQYDMLARAAARVPVWAARAARRMDPDRAAALLPSAQWTLYQSGTRTGAGAGDDREIVFRSTREYEWIARETARGDRRGAIESIANETWSRLAARRERGDDLTGEDYYLTIYRETMYAAAAIGRREHDRPRRAVIETARDRARREGRTLTPAEIETARAGNPETRSLDDPAMTAAARYPSPEAETITRETIRAAAADDLDRIILRGLRWGWTQCQIARYAGEIAARDRAIAAGETLTPAEIETARAAGETYQRRISRKIAAMADRLRAAGVLRPVGEPGYRSVHNPGPAPIASPVSTREAREIVTDPARIAAAREIVPAAPAPRETAPARPVPSLLTAPAVLPRPVWETRTAAPAPVPAQIADPETMTPAEIMRRVHANGSPEAQDRRTAATLRAADRIAARIAAAAARAAAPARFDDPDPETLRRRETLRRARETIAAAAKARRERIAREIARERSAR